jgi:hypothetical protein
MSNVLLIALVRFVLEIHEGGIKENNTSDTISYNGFIAIEMANTKSNTRKRIVDLADIYNRTNCLGFVLLKDNISEKNFEQSFFPLALCDKKVANEEILNNNNRFYDTIFNIIKTSSADYRKVIKVKGVGNVQLNYKIIKVKLRYTVTGRSTLEKYVREKVKSNEDLQINSKIGKILSLIVE